MKGLILCFGVIAIAAGTLHAVESEIAPPEDTWYRAFLEVKESQEFEARGEILAALNATDSAFEMFKALTLDSPDFHPDLVKARLQLIADKRFQLQSQLKASAPPTQERSEIEQLKDELKRIKIRRDELLKKLDQIRESINRESSQPVAWTPREDNLLSNIPTESLALDPIPKNWIPRDFEGQMTYLIPLIETVETKAFSKIPTVPAVLRTGR